MKIFDTVEVDLLLCSKYDGGQDTRPLKWEMYEMCSKKSNISIKGYECTQVIEQIAKTFPITMVGDPLETSHSRP